MSFQTLWKLNRSGCCSVITKNPNTCTNKGGFHTCSPRYPYLIRLYYPAVHAYPTTYA